MRNQGRRRGRYNAKTKKARNRKKEARLAQVNGKGERVRKQQERKGRRENVLVSLSNTFLRFFGDDLHV
jgi:hypothetical protein